MSLETKTQLNQATVDAIESLIRANLDAATGFKRVAEQIADEKPELLFRQLSIERMDLAAELQSYVTTAGHRPPEDGTWLAAFHRCWIDLMATFYDHDTAALLVEVERGEDHIKSAYEQTIRQTAGSPLNDVFLRQYAEIKDAIQEIQTMRYHFEAM